MNTSHAFYDTSRLVALRRLVRDLDPSGPPRARFLGKPRIAAPSRLALLPGSFNPPTVAHIGLADAVLATGAVDRVDFLLASRTVDKERVEGLTLADRLLLLEVLCETRPDFGVILVNRGLYVDQAELVRSAAPGVSDLWFAVGFDKVVQIFDPRYYQDRKESLERLFSLARIFVAPRADVDASGLRELLSRPENRPYAARVTSLELPAALRQVSSTRLRAHDPLATDDVSPVIAGFIRETGVYGSGAPDVDESGVDRYAARNSLLDQIESGDEAVLSPSELRGRIDRIASTKAISNTIETAT